MTEREVIHLYRYLNCYDNLDQLATATGFAKRTLTENSRDYLSNNLLQALADAFGVTYQALVLSFRVLQDLDYEDKNDRKKAMMYLLSLSYNKKKT